MSLKRLALQLLLLLCVPAAFAQTPTLTVDSTDPANGTADVPNRKMVLFDMNRDLPVLGTSFLSKFDLGPLASMDVLEQGHDPQQTGDFDLVFFDIEHDDGEDFSIYVYGLATCGQSGHVIGDVDCYNPNNENQRSEKFVMTRPHALNYSTAAAIGSHTVSGTATVAERVLEGPSKTGLSMIEAVVRGHRDGLAQAGKRHDLRGGAGFAVNGRVDFDLERSVILLLEGDFTTQEPVWTVASATAIEADGTFSLDFVREGTYFPILASWGDVDGNSFGGFGFYDPDGDLDPESITVGTGGMADLDLKVFKMESFATDADMLALVRERAARVWDDQRLIAIEAELAEEDGQSLLWRYEFYSPSQDDLTHVRVDPILTEIIEEPVDRFNRPLEPTDFQRQATPIGESVIGSETAMRNADAYIGNQYRSMLSEPPNVFVVAGDLELDSRPDEDETFWLITYEDFSGSIGPQYVFVDMETGHILKTEGAVGTDSDELPAAFRLERNYPNPFNPETTIRYSLARAAHVRLAVYDVLGREVKVLADGMQPAGAFEATWDGTDTAGRALPSGVYLYRLQAEGFSQSHAMTLLK